MIADTQAKREKIQAELNAKLTEYNTALGLFNTTANDYFTTTTGNTAATNAFAASLENLKRKIDLIKPKMEGPVDIGPDAFTNPKIGSQDILKGFGINPSEPVPGIVTQPEADMLDLDKQLEAFETMRQKMEETGLAAAQMGEAIGEAFGAALTSQQGFAQAMIQVTGQIIQMYLKQSLAAMIAASIEDPTVPLPLAKIAMMGVGMGLVKAAFAQLGASAGGGGGGGSYGPPGRAPSEMNHTITGRIRGYDLAIVSQKEAYRRKWLG